MHKYEQTNGFLMGIWNHALHVCVNELCSNPVAPEECRAGGGQEGSQAALHRQHAGVHHQPAGPTPGKTARQYLPHCILLSSPDTQHLCLSAFSFLSVYT